MSTPYNRLRSYAEALGYTYLKRGKGSHQKWKHPATGRIVTIPWGKRRRTAIANIEMRLRQGADKERVR